MTSISTRLAARSTRRRRLRITTTVCLSIAFAACSREPVEEPTSDEPLAVTASVPSSTVEVGARPVYRLDIEYRDDLEVGVPALGEEIGDLEVAEAGGESAAVRGGRRRLSRWFRLRADRPGSYILPAVEVTAVRRTPDESPATGDDPAEAEQFAALAPEIYLDVVSVLAQEGSEDIRDVKPVREVGGRRWLLLLFAGGLLLVLFGALFAWWMLRRRPKVAATPVEPEIPPHEWALAELRRLRRVDFGDLDTLRQVYFELSAVVRTYVERRFALNATDLTTEEIVQAAHRLAGIDTAMQRRLTGVLMAADQVKFARQIPGEIEIDETWSAASTFVEQTAELPTAQQDDAAPAATSSAEGQSGEAA